MTWIVIIILILLAIAFPYISIPVVIISLLIYFFKNKSKQTNNKISKKNPSNQYKKKKKRESTETSLSLESKKATPEKPWVISISFGESTSKNFNRALFLAEQANYFSNYTTEDGTKVYQADFSKDNFLNYLDLYKVVSNWKSSFVFINGQRVNKKELSTINRCYGDKMSFNDSHFCFGASMHTENPFGCHRLMITPSQGSWKTYGVAVGNYWVIDKPAIARKIIEQSKHVENCPAFNLQRSLGAIKKLPDKIKMDDNYFLL